MELFLHTLLFIDGFYVVYEESNEELSGDAGIRSVERISWTWNKQSDSINQLLIAQNRLKIQRRGKRSFLST